MIRRSVIGPPLIILVAGETGSPSTLGRVEVRPLGHVPQTAMADIHRAADIAVHASLADTFPFAVIEAMACGTPVVATAVGGITEQLRDGEHGLLVPPRDPHALCGALLRLAEDAELRRHMGTAAAARVQSEFTIDRVVDRHLAMYQGLPGMHLPA